MIKNCGKAGIGLYGLSFGCTADYRRKYRYFKLSENRCRRRSGTEYSERKFRSVSGHAAPWRTGTKKEMKDAYEKEHLMSPELPYESRYFSVLLNEDGKALSADTGQIVSVDDSEAMEYAETVWEKGQE